jgi:outer membrane murein-binding lipoprotein Lpp
MSTDTIISLVALAVTLLGGLIAVIKILAKIEPLDKTVDRLDAEVDALRAGQQGVLTSTQQASASTVGKAHARIDELVQNDLVAIRTSVGKLAQQHDSLRTGVEYQSKELERAVVAVQQLLLADRERAVEHHALVDRVDRDITEGRERQKAIADLDARLRVQEARRD